MKRQDAVILKDASGLSRACDVRVLLRHAAVHPSGVDGAADENALEVWRALLDGHFSLVDCFDFEGRRYLVARLNDAHERALRALSEREIEVVSLAALGHPNKIIACELGLTMSRVAMELASAIRKLGVRSRIDLIRSLPPEPMPESA
jgi:DNA-binding NarL/FixJ family response regulator